MELEKTLYMNDLFALYQGLLTERQRLYMSEYYEEDFTLQEIAENHDVSRQAVYDSLKRTEKLLQTYEETLHLNQYSEQRYDWFQNISSYIKANHQNDNQLIQFINLFEEKFLL